MRAIDLLWVLAYPAYQVIGTFRHEAAHALIAWMEGARIEKVSILPSRDLGHFSWGYVLWRGDVTWRVAAAPYGVDLLCAAVAFPLALQVALFPHWVWVNLVVIGLLSPLVNTGYNYYYGGIRSGRNDVGKLLLRLPSVPVHACFVLTMIAYAAALGWVIRAAG